MACNGPAMILVVEGGSVSREAILWILSRFNVLPVAVDTLEAAREVLDLFVPQIVLLDLHVRDGDGSELVEDLRYTNMSVKIAAVTSVTESTTLAKFTDWKPDAIFPKPLEEAEFVPWLVKQLIAIDADASLRPAEWSNLAA